MNEPGPFFYAWCHDDSRGDAFASALCSLATPEGRCSLMMSAVMRGPLSIAEVVDEVRASFVGSMSVYADFSVSLPSGRSLRFYGHCFGAGLERRGAHAPLDLTPFNQGELLPERLQVAWGRGAPTGEIEATIAAILVQPEIEDLLLRFCAPDMSARVPIGGCTERAGWGAPIENAASYHADAAEIARDLALSWVHIHDRDDLACIAGASLSALRGRVEAAPGGARIALKGGAELTREVVLKALDMSPSTLLDALEVSALPDGEWRASEPYALEALEAMKMGAPTYEADILTRKHRRFLEEHAPFHVRRLPSGGVLLATHPYRRLWPLWEGALFVLGLM